MAATLFSLLANLIMAGWPDWTWLLSALVAWYVADLVSGVVHMVMDYKPCRTGVGLERLYFYEGSRESSDYLALRDAVWTRIGPIEKLIYDFKNHHPRPEALGRRPMLTQIGSSILFGTLPASLLLNAAAYAVPLPGWLLFGAVVLLVASSFAQYFHGTLHRDDNPPMVKAMRALGLLMTPAAHAKHHATLTRDFATNCGWSNPLVNHLFAVAIRRRWLMEEGLTPQ